MISMAAALKKAGVITDEDMRQAEERAKIQAKAEAEQAEIKAKQRIAEFKVAMAYDNAMSGIPVGLAREMYAWMTNTGKLIPLGVLEAWSKLDDVLFIHREWAKWLAAYREANKVSA